MHEPCTGSSLARVVVMARRSPQPHKVGGHAAWAMAVGGMIGGGIYTLAGVIVGIAGPWGWASIAIGALIALATVNSYAQLTRATGSSGVPLTIFLRDGKRPTAHVLAWALLAVYVLSLAVYTFTAGHYFGAALGVGRVGIVVIELAIVTTLVVLNLFQVQHPAMVQIIAVWVEFAILAALATIGLVNWSPENLGRGVPEGSVSGVLVATASTFIAFEGFEMLAYDLRELRTPKKIMREYLPLAVIAVALAYALVTVGAASLVGADVLVAQQESALAAAGHAAAGFPGLVVVTIAAVASATSAINATLFSAARLARTAANHALLPKRAGRVNRYGSPASSTIAIAAVAVVVAAVSQLRFLVAIASLGFLSLFCLVNVIAVRKRVRHRGIAAAGAFGAAASIVIVIATLLR